MWYALFKKCFYKTYNAEYKNEELVKCKRKKKRSLKNKQADAVVRDEGI